MHALQCMYINQLACVGGDRDRKERKERKESTLHTYKMFRLQGDLCMCIQYVQYTVRTYIDG